MILFLQNKYSKWYDQIIEQAKNRSISDPVEYHHVIPKSLGGPNTEENLVPLLFREHFLVHWLLTKMMVTDDHRRKMLCALSYLRNKNKTNTRILTGWQYQKSREARIAAMKGKVSPMKGLTGDANPLFGTTRKPEHIAKMKKTKQENPFQISDEHRSIIREIGKGLWHGERCNKKVISS